MLLSLTLYVERILFGPPQIFSLRSKQTQSNINDIRRTECVEERERGKSFSDTYYHGNLCHFDTPNEL